MLARAGGLMMAIIGPDSVGQMHPKTIGSYDWQLSA